MGRILAIDYGTKRIGLAVTDPLRIIATALTTVAAHEAVVFIKEYCSKEPVDLIVIGLPIQMNGEASESEKHIQPFMKHLKTALPNMPFTRYDERFTSKMAGQSMIDAGFKKKQRQDKKRLDSMAATIILQGYLQSTQ
jgi:putative Holliday junction resolvase